VSENYIYTPRHRPYIGITTRALQVQHDEIVENVWISLAFNYASWRHLLWISIKALMWWRTYFGPMDVLQTKLCKIHALPSHEASLTLLYKYVAAARVAVGGRQTVEYLPRLMHCNLASSSRIMWARWTGRRQDSMKKWQAWMVTQARKEPVAGPGSKR
jgi:hypothetical protein